MAEVTPEQAPRKVRDLFEKGRVAMERGNLDYAIDLFMQVVELEPGLLHARKYLRAAEVKRFKEKKGGKAAHVFSSISGSGVLLSGMGQIKKNPKKALVSAEKLLAKDPLNMQFINFFGQAAVAADLPEAAIQTLELAKEFYPENTDILNWLGSLYLDTEQPQKARESFEEVVKLLPTDQKAIKALKDATALATMQKGGWEGAGSYQDVLKDKKESSILEQDSKAVKSAKDVESLIADMKTKITQEPGNVNYRRALADLYGKINEFDQAIAVLEETQQKGADPQIDLSISRVKVRKMQAEIEQLQASGDEAGAAEKAKALDAFQLKDAQERVQRYPNDLNFRYELGTLLQKHGQLNEAIQQFQMAQRNPQHRIRALYYLALCFKEKGQHDIAMEQLEKAASELYRMDDTKKDIVYQMGLLAEAMGQPEKAVEHYKEIYAVDIGYKDVADKIDRAYDK